MYYKKKRITRRSFRRTTRPNYNPRWTIYGRAGTQLVKDVAMLKGLINTEFKTVDTTFTAAAVSTTPVRTVLNDIGTGTDSNQRTGRSVLIKSVFLDGIVTMSPAATTTSVKFAIVKDIEAGSHNFADVFSATNVVSLRNIDNTIRFPLVKVRQHNLSVDKQEYRVRMYIPLNFHTKYSSTTATSQVSNALNLWYISDEAVNTAVFTGIARVRFIDN